MVSEVKLNTLEGREPSGRALVKVTIPPRTHQGGSTGLGEITYWQLPREAVCKTPASLRRAPAHERRAQELHALMPLPLGTAGGISCWHSLPQGASPSGSNSPSCGAMQASSKLAGAGGSRGVVNITPGTGAAAAQRRKPEMGPGFPARSGTHSCQMGGGGLDFPCSQGKQLGADLKQGETGAGNCPCPQHSFCFYGKESTTSLAQRQGAGVSSTHAGCSGLAVWLPQSLLMPARHQASPPVRNAAVSSFQLGMQGRKVLGCHCWV